MGCSNLVLLLAQIGILKMPWRKVLDDGNGKEKVKGNKIYISVGFDVISVI